jgi:tRNA pseudouridine38-40 synthase
MMTFTTVGIETEKRPGEAEPSSIKTPERYGAASKLTRVCLIVEYDGSRYYGFQLQDNLPTIQGELENAITKLTKEKARINAASRTDTGVHALRQVVTFRTSSLLSSETFIKGLNHHLPPDIAIKTAYPVLDSFDPRRQAISREYHYSILNSLTPSPLTAGFSHLITSMLDTDAMNQIAQSIVGEHDFTSFASSLGSKPKVTRRHVYQATVEREDEVVVFKMVANSFLPHQVRNTIGTLIRIGLGKMTSYEFHSIMDARKPGLAGPSAPAAGLCLMKVNYNCSLKEERQ